MPLLALSLLTSCNNPEPLEECTWEKISAISKAGNASEWFKVGDEKTVEVNGQPHKVRIIGFNQDKDLNNKPIGITFEFVNLISDSNGCSLATLWNEGIKTKLGEASFDYLNSSIR